MELFRQVAENLFALEKFAIDLRPAVAYRTTANTIIQRDPGSNDLIAFAGIGSNDLPFRIDD